MKPWIWIFILPRSSCETLDQLPKSYWRVDGWWKNMYSIKPCILDAYQFQPFGGQREWNWNQMLKSRYHYHFKRRLLHRRHFALRLSEKASTIHERTSRTQLWESPEAVIYVVLLQPEYFQNEQLKPISYIYIWGYENETINKKGACFSKRFCPSSFWWAPT